jgi:hypothetical protein
MPADLFNPIGGTGSGATTTLRRSPDRSEHVKRVHALFGFLGFVAAIAGAVWAYSETSSIALPIFVFAEIQFFVARGLGDVATDPDKAKRFVYFALFPALSFGVLYLTYQWWGLMWLAALLGSAVGIMAWNLLVLAIFPEIHQAEIEDTEHRKETGGI